MLTATVDIKSLFGDQHRHQAHRACASPCIHVKVLEDGRANWDIAKVDSRSRRSSVGHGSIAFNIGLREYWIEDGTLIYDDASLTYCHGPARALITRAAATSHRTSSP